MVLTVKVEDPEPKQFGSIVGVDSGIKNIFSAIDRGTGKTLYINGGHLAHQRRCIRQTRAKVATVGTHSANRLLKRLSGREKSVTQQIQHVASERLVTWAESVGARVIVMEDLGNVRHSSLKKGKHLRSGVHRWPYAQGQFFVQYKAVSKGIAFEIVDPRWTSQACPRCGHVEKSNRHQLSFRCKACGFADTCWSY